MLPIISEFISALDSEIKALKKGHSGNTVQIYNGEFLYESNNLFVYMFSLDSILVAIDDTPAEIEVNKENYKCYIVTIDGQNVTISIENDLGKKIPTAKLKINAWYLLEILKEKYEETGADTKKFAQSVRLFRGESYRLDKTNFVPQYSGEDDPMNKSQKDAIEASINNSLCIIWGPPGTGKTSAIAKLVEAHLNLGRKVLLVSHANNAVDEAMIKIAEQLKNSDFYKNGELIRFGVMKEDFMKKVKGKYDNILPDKILEIKSRNLIEEKNRLLLESNELNEELKQIEEIQKLVESVSETDSEITILRRDLNNKARLLKDLESRLSVLSEKQKQLLEDLEKAEVSSTLKRFLFRLDPAEIRRKLDYTNTELSEKFRQRDAIQIELSRINVELTEKENQKYSNVKILESELSKIGISIKEVGTKLSDITNKLTANQAKIKKINKAIEEIESNMLKEAQLVATTLTKTYLSKQIDPLTFDVLIVDEVSMAPQPMLFWAASKALLAITIVGDFKQLPPICASENELAKKWLEKSIFDTLGINEVEKASNDKRVKTLRAQYRMNPEISVIPRKLIYNNVITDGEQTENKKIKDPVSGYSPLVLIDTSKHNPWASQISSGGRFNLYNALLAIDLVEKILPALKEAERRDGEDNYKIGIITPYRAQANLMIKIVEDKGINKNRVRISTVHSFQGGEEKVIIFDTVEGNGAKNWSMLNEDNDKDADKLINVAITRAEAKFYLIANKDYILEKFPSNSIIVRILEDFNWSIIPSYEIVPSWETSDFDKWANKLYETESNKSVRGSRAYNQDEFWPQFYNDLKSAKESVIIFSPFISIERTAKLINLFTSIINRNVKLLVVTRPPNEQFGRAEDSTKEAIEKLQQIGVIFSFRSNMHQKISIIDNEIAWEGSLNILSYRNTQEHMRRLTGEKTIKQLCEDLSIDDLVKAPIENQFCPECLSKGKKNYIVLRHGKYGDFYGCSSYPDCNWMMPVKKSNKYGNNQSFSQPKEWETSICYWSTEEKPGYTYSRKKNAWYKKK